MILSPDGLTDPFSPPDEEGREGRRRVSAIPKNREMSVELRKAIISEGKSGRAQEKQAMLMGGEAMGRGPGIIQERFQCPHSLPAPARRLEGPQSHRARQPDGGDEGAEAPTLPQGPHGGRHSVQPLAKPITSCLAGHTGDVQPRSSWGHTGAFLLQVST